MSPEQPSPQRISRLTPLRDVVSYLESKVGPVATRTMSVDDALGCVLAEDYVAPSALPPYAIALRDGFAVQSDATSDASSYAPAILSSEPVFVNAGERMPDGCDAVAPADTVIVQGDQAQIAAPVAPAEGMLPKAGDASSSQILARKGTRLSVRDIAVLRASGFVDMTVRQPRLRLLQTGATGDAIARTAISMLTACIEDSGAIALHDESASLSAVEEAADAIIAVGGTGMGRNDSAISTLANRGDVAFHGIALSPGDTAAVGMMDKRPVLLFPGRIDAALAGWLALGRPLLARLAGATSKPVTHSATLSRKIASSIGMTDIVLVLREGEKAEPLASGYWAMHALARANGFVTVPPESEGYPAGSRVAVSDLP
jgi:molybdopterin biosynthesis enzyme